MCIQGADIRFRINDVSLCTGAVFFPLCNFYHDIIHVFDCYRIGIFGIPFACEVGGSVYTSPEVDSVSHGSYSYAAGLVDFQFSFDFYKRGVLFRIFIYAGVRLVLIFNFLFTFGIFFPLVRVRQVADIRSNRAAFMLF